MKKVKVILAGMVVSILLLCTACGGSTKMSNELLKSAIMESNANYDTYSLSITDFSVSNRSYDKQYKTEDVMVEIVAENQESTYETTYAVMGSRESGNWNVTSVQLVEETTLPKEVLLDELVIQEAAKLLQDQKNERYNLTGVKSWDYSVEPKQNVGVDLHLCSDTMYMNTTRDYELNYQYSLSGWKLTKENGSDVNVEITNELCGTWTGFNAEDDYEFVIDHIEGDTAYVKYRVKVLMPKYGWSKELITRGYDTLTPVQISVVYNDWESPYYGLEIIFEKTKYSPYGMFDDPMTIGMRVYPRASGSWNYSNGTVEEGKSYITSYISTFTVNDPCILTKQ